MNTRIQYIYRISDGSYKKERFPFATKEKCFLNFLEIFSPTKDELVLIADRVGPNTFDMLRENSPSEPIKTAFGNGAHSWRHGAEQVIRDYSWGGEIDRDKIVYFIEDDYLHLPGSKQILIEGMEIADYVSLYDHPDKYIGSDQGGNMYVEHGGELTRVLRTPSCHFKMTNSTTMTFAVRPKTLMEDWKVWDNATTTTHPNDFGAFIELMHKPRYLITPIPTYATHCEVAWAAPGVNWETLERL